MTYLTSISTSDLVPSYLAFAAALPDNRGAAIVPLPRYSGQTLIATPRSRAIASISTLPSVALGGMSPSEVQTETKRLRGFLAAFGAGRELACEMVAEDEMDPPDSAVWTFAENAITPFAAYLPPPLVSPLQLGGVTCEWHDQGMNIELRFRGMADVFAVIEDARREVAEFHGRDPNLRLAKDALCILIQRQV